MHRRLRSDLDRQAYTALTRGRCPCMLLLALQGNYRAGSVRAQCTRSPCRCLHLRGCRRAGGRVGNSVRRPDHGTGPDRSCNHLVNGPERLVRMAAAPPPLQGGSASSLGDAAKFGVLTISDRASAGVYDDLSGPAILGFLAEAVQSPWEAVYRVIPDEQRLIEGAIVEMVGHAVHGVACGIDRLDAWGACAMVCFMGVGTVAGGQPWLLPGGDDRWHGPCAARRDARGDGRRVPAHAAWLWRADAGRQPQIRAHGGAVATNSG